MLQHVTVAGERVAEVLKKLFTIIVTNIFVQNLHDRHLFYFYNLVLSLFHTANINCNEFLMRKHFKDNNYAVLLATNDQICKNRSTKCI